MAFIRSPVSDSEDLALDLLVDEPTVLAVPTGHPLSRSTSAPLRAFGKDTFVLFPREFNSSNYDAIIAACQHAGFSPKLGQEGPQIVSVIPLVAAGLGVSIVPRSMNHILLDAVFYLPIDEGAPRAVIGLAYRRDDRSRAVRNFIATAQAMRRAQGTGNGIAKVTEKDNVQRH